MCDTTFGENVLGSVPQVLGTSENRPQVPATRWPQKKKGQFWKFPTNKHPLACSVTGLDHSTCLRSNSSYDQSVILEVDFNSVQISLPGCSHTDNDSCSPHAVLPCPEPCQPAEEPLESRSLCSLSLSVCFPHLSPSMTVCLRPQKPGSAHRTTAN